MNDIQIDGLIARHVFEFYEAFEMSEDCREWYYDPEVEGERKSFPCAPYTTDMTAAWTIIERLKSRAWYIAIGDLKSGLWVVRIKRRPLPGLEPAEGAVVGRSAARTICLAALKALGVRYEDFV